MKNYKSQKVVQANDLITSVAKMDKIPLKIFELAVSCIDVNNPPENNTVYLSKDTLFSFFNVADNDKHSRFKEAVVFCNKKVQRIATKNTECCHPIFSLFSRQCVC